VSTTTSPTGQPDNVSVYRRIRLILDFFGFQEGGIAIVQSCILDANSNAYIPSCDIRTARVVATLFRSIGLEEATDYVTVPDREIVLPDSSLRPEFVDLNMVLLCGPKRNYLTGQVLQNSPILRYSMYVDQETGNNVLYDRATNTPLLPTRDLPANQQLPGVDLMKEGHDFGLIMSVPLTSSPSHTAVVLAGVHGAGTLGAAMVLSDVEQLGELCRRRRNGVIQEVVIAHYRGHIENVVDVRLL
jgi:hypothetical protein